jgi:hypothetical protein
VIKIEQLDVRFDVEGEGDEAVFARLFERHIRRWGRAESEARARQRLVERERSLTGGGRNREGE